MHICTATERMRGGTAHFCARLDVRKTVHIVQGNATASACNATGLTGPFGQKGHKRVPQLTENRIADSRRLVVKSTTDLPQQVVNCRQFENFEF